MSSPTLGIDAPDAIERARAEHTLPQSAEGSRAYVEGLSRLDTFDATGAHSPCAIPEERGR